MIKKFVVKGLVQGIGYRPWVARLAEELNISGWVRNTGGIVTVLACGNEAQLWEMKNRLSKDVPEGGFVLSVEEEIIPEEKGDAFNEFKIIESDKDEAENLPLIPADLCTCEKCKEELFDKTNRRYLHPFISCTVCGPRYSIIEKLPYDRDTITMADFELCPDCKREYTAKADRRRHAQTIACKKCGPSLEFKGINENARNLARNPVHRKFTSEFLENLENETPELANATRIVGSGGILAVKDIGGYHLVCNPFDGEAVSKLRLLKHREAKAFAVMFFDIDEANKYCRINEKEAELLKSSARPIVLVGQKRDASIQNFSENVCLSSPYIGAMLPSNPVQLMLTKALGPLIMTSGNASGDVLETNDEKMCQWLTERANAPEMQNVAIAMLSNNRRILRPMDDSVMKVVKGRTQFIRRGRGHVPAPITVDIDGEIFAAGGDLKSTFCYVKDKNAYVSQHLGDMESVACQNFYRKEQGAMKDIFGFKPQLLAVDKHPGYFSKKAGMDFWNGKNDTSFEIQHHKAHVASVIAEHRLKGAVLGFAFDGTGYGDDGSIWGSEAFLWNGKSQMERVAHLLPVKLIGGDEGAKNCDTILAGMAHAYELDGNIEKLCNKWENEPNAQENFINNCKVIVAALDNNINAVTSTSMGRLFDAVAALLDICHYNTYEGQGPVELENVAATANKAYPLHISDDGSTGQMLKDMTNAISAGVDKAELARGFIIAVSDYIVDIANAYQSKLDVNCQVVLSGGTFLNKILLEDVITKLEKEGFNVFIAEQLPPGDGGICLGQAYLTGRCYNENPHALTK